MSTHRRDAALYGLWNPGSKTFIQESFKGDSIMEKILIANIKILFKDKWEYFELGSSQADLIEAHVIKTIKDTLKGIK